MTIVLHRNLSWRTMGAWGFRSHAPRPVLHLNLRLTLYGCTVVCRSNLVLQRWYTAQAVRKDGMCADGTSKGTSLNMHRHSCAVIFFAISYLRQDPLPEKGGNRGGGPARVLVLRQRGENLVRVWLTRTLEGGFVIRGGEGRIRDTSPTYGYSVP